MYEYGATCTLSPGIRHDGSVMPEPIRLRKEFIHALENRDFSQMAVFFAREVRFRALVPPGICEAGNPAGAISWLQRWFGEADQFQVLAATVEQVFDRLYFRYRLRVHDDANGWRVIEQQAYCNVKAGEIDDIRLLCSGFRPE